MKVSIVFPHPWRLSLAATPRSILVLLAFLFASTALRAQSAHYEGAQMALGGSGVAAYGVAVDSQGNTWLADNYLNSVTEISPTGGVDASYAASTGQAALSVFRVRSHFAAGKAQ